MSLAEEAGRMGVPVPTTKPTVHCKLFEDNSGALELARLPKMCPRTKHINVKMHHFPDHVAAGKISILPVKTEDQVADIFTKPLGVELFRKFRSIISGW